MDSKNLEQLSKTVTMLGAMTPAEAEAHLHAIHHADPLLANKVYSHWQLHLSKEGDWTATVDYRPEDRTPEVDATGAFIPRTTVRQGLAPSAAADDAKFSDHPSIAVSAIHYKDLAALGHGTFGTVYKATDTRTGQTIALKTMRRSDGRALDFFKGEFRYLQGIAHANLVQLLALESDGSNWLIVMEFVPGEDYLSYVRPQESELDVDRLRAALPQLVEGVAALHRHRRLHRDLKPQNVRVTPEGRVVVLDFGLAAEAGPRGELRYADHGTPGTVPYMAPEQFQYPPLSSTASDMYSLGVMLYESLTGRWPYTGSVGQIVQGKANRDPSPPRDICPEAPEDLNALCIELLAREPGSRPDAEEIFRRLRHTPASPADRPPEREEAALLGRARELGELNEAYLMARQGAPVVLKVHGPSGIGKSVLVGHFIDRLSSQGAVILAGRCYEHESIPYKALDPVVDELARFLNTIPEAAVAGLTPTECGPLVKMFPALQRIGPIERAASGAVLPQDQQELRRSAFLGLRLLLGNLSETCPLVIHIDDLQWGDIDSAHLLAELIRPPTAPSILWILAHRSEDANSACLRTLVDALDRAGVPVQNLPVHPLTEAETAELVVRSLGEEARGRVGEIFKESQGNPYFVAELVHAVRSGVDDVERADLTLDGLILSRVSCLPVAARQLLELVAVSGRPLDDIVAYRAAEENSDARTAAARLEAGRLLRGIGDAGQIALETYHDRVREAVLSSLSAEACRDCHGRLGRTLEESGRADVDQLALHFEGAGENDKAGRYYNQAGDQATQTVAFDQAAMFFRKALELQELGNDAVRELRQKLGDALSNAGRGAEAGPVYLAAAEGADGIQVLELRRRAMDAMLQAGRTDEGMELLGELFEALGDPLPDGPEQAMERMMSEFGRLLERGPDFIEKPENAVSLEELWKLDLLYAAGWRIYTRNCVLGTYYFLRAARWALDTGEPRRAARALASAATINGWGGDKQARELAWNWFGKAEGLVRRIDEPYWSSYIAMKKGFLLWGEGNWSDAVKEFSEAERIAFQGQVSMAAFFADMHKIALHSKMMMGSWKDYLNQAGELLHEAQRQDNLYMTCSMLISNSLRGLVLDQPQLAEELNTKGWEMWPKIRHISAGHLRLSAFIDIYLYRGQVKKAVDLLQRELEQIRTLTGYEFIEVWNLTVSHTQGRVAVAAASELPINGHETDQRTQFLHEAEKLATVIEGHQMPWADPLAKLLRCGIANLRSESDSAIQILSEAEACSDAAGMLMYSAAARRQRGRLIGGEEGQALVSSADAFMAGEGVIKPDRIAAMLAPGFPD